MNQELTQIRADINMLFLRVEELDQKIDKIVKNNEGQTTLTQQPEEKRMYPAICHICNDKCAVPFKPHEGAKIKCKQCWLKQKEAEKL
jgi:CxxC-x17-CxxC domain-containing protein